MNHQVAILPPSSGVALSLAAQTVDPLSRLEALMIATAEQTDPAAIELGLIAVSDLLYTDQMVDLVADPRRHGQLRALRAKWADCWSNLHGQVEFHFAHQRRQIALADLLTECRSHPLFWKTNDLYPAELALLKQHIPNLPSAHVCHIGCGALPYTALHYQPHVGAITVVDVWSEACKLCQGLCHAHSLGFEVVQQWAEEHDYRRYNLVLLSSMLTNKDAIIRRIAQTAPAFLLCRSTNTQRPGGMLENPLSDHDLALIPGTFLGQTVPPRHVADLSFLFQLRA